MAAPAPQRHTSNLGAILNDEEPKPQLLLDEAQLTALHKMLVAQTSGCSLEQLEQINAALMDAIWRHRTDYNRNVVLHKVQDAFNEIIQDIQVMQQILRFSQETPESETQYTSAQGPVVSRPPPFGTQEEGFYSRTQHN
jgi:hypothetical protein